MKSNNNNTNSKEEISNLKKGNIKLKFSDGTSNEYEINSILIINPNLFNEINKNGNYEIILPDFITKNSLMDFLFLIKNGLNEIDELSGNDPNKFLNLIKISDFFQNNVITIKIIKDIILKRINEVNAFDFLNFSYEKLKSNNNEEIDYCYFELFYRCLEIIGNDEHLFIKNLDKIKHLDKKVIDELLQKTFSHLIYGNYIYLENENEDLNSNEIEPESYFDTINDNEKKKQLNFISMNNLNNLVSSLYDIYGTQNFFELLTLEYMSLFSQESINELNEVPNPTFQVKINYEDIGNYYEEYPINFSINNKSIIFVIFYKISDDSFNVCMKFGDNPKLKNKLNHNHKNINSVDENFCFKIFTFLSIVKVHRGNIFKSLSSQTNLKCLSNNKSMHTIFKLTNFTSAINKSNLMKENLSNENNSESFFVSINLKLCYIHSVLTSYLLRNYSKLCRLNEINKISKQLLVLILKNKFLNKKSENEIVIGINKWLNDEINLKEDITELIDSIKWEYVDDEYIFEFMIKYSNMIVGNELAENLFIKTFQKKYNAPFIYDLINSFLKATNIINYSTIYTLMKKNEKFNVAYLSSSTHNSNHNNNFSTTTNSNVKYNNITNSNTKFKNNGNNLNFREKSKSYSYSKRNINNINNNTMKKITNTKKTIKNPMTTKENNKSIIDLILKQKINNKNNLNKTILSSKAYNIYDRKKSAINLCKSDSKNKIKITKKIQDIKTLFSSKNSINNKINNNENISQFSNTDSLIEKTIFKDDKRKIHKRNITSLIHFNHTINSNKINIINNYISQNQFFRKKYTVKNSFNISYTNANNMMKSYDK